MTDTALRLVIITTTFLSVIVIIPKGAFTEKLKHEGKERLIKDAHNLYWETVCTSRASDQWTPTQHLTSHNKGKQAIEYQGAALSNTATTDCTPRQLPHPRTMLDRYFTTHVQANDSSQHYHLSTHSIKTTQKMLEPHW